MTTQSRSPSPVLTDEIEFVFREPRTVQEMEGILSVRYRSYARTTGLAHIDSLDHECGLDADAFDLRQRQ